MGFGEVAMKQTPAAPYIKSLHALVLMLATRIRPVHYLTELVFRLAYYRGLL